MCLPADKELHGHQAMFALTDQGKSSQLTFEPRFVLGEAFHRLSRFEI